MKIKFKTDVDGEDKITTIQAIDNDGNYLEGTVLYSQDSLDEYFPGISNSDETLFEMMNHIYNSGKNQEEIIFEKE